MGRCHGSPHIEFKDPKDACGHHPLWQEIAKKPSAVTTVSPIQAIEELTADEHNGNKMEYEMPN